MPVSVVLVSRIRRPVASGSPCDTASLPAIRSSSARHIAARAGNCPMKPNCLTASFHSSSLAPGCIPDSTLRFHSSLRAAVQELSSYFVAGSRPALISGARRT